MEQPDELSTLIKETVDSFQKIEFHEIDERFVRYAWSSGFSECGNYDPSAELLLPPDDIATINELCSVCESWTSWSACNNAGEKPDAVDCGGGGVLLDPSNSSEENLFTVLMKSGISLQNIVSFVFVFCTKATKQTSTLHEKVIGLCFTRFYFILLTVPASSAYRIYHPNVFQVAIDNLKLPKEKVSSKRSNSSSVYRSDSYTPSKRRRQSTFESDAPNEPDDALDYSEIQESQPTENEFETKECSKITNYISLALLSLIELLGKFSLKRDQDILEHTIQQLVGCSACETVHTNLQFNLCPTDVVNLKSRYGIPFIVTCLAFKALSVICDPKHGNENRNYLKVLKHLMQNILCSNSRSNHSVTRKYLVIKDNSAAFVAFNMKKDPEKYVKSTRTLLQQLCVKVQEKSDVRARIASCIISILYSFPDEHYCDMLDWFQRLVLNAKVQSRVFGLEIYAQILNQSVDMNHPKWNSPSVLGMIQSLISRCNDKATSVRTKALTVVSNNLKIILKILKQSASEEPQCSPDGGNSQTFCGSPVENYTETIDDIVRMLHRRIGDDKVYVRKAALQAMEKVISLDISYLNVNNLKVFQKAAEDASVSIRKQVLQSLTVIMQNYVSIDTVHEIWLETVLRLVLDPESSVQDKCLEVLEMVIFHHIGSRQNHNAWDIIMHITTRKHQYLQRYLEKAVFMLIRSERISPSFASSLKQHIGSSKDPAVWLLLSLIVPYVRVKNPSDIINYYNNLDDGTPVPTMNNVLKVISHTVKSADEVELKLVQEKLEHQLTTFSRHHQLISKSLEALSSIYNVLTEKHACLVSFSSFCEKLMKDCEKYLSAVVLKESQVSVTEDEMISRLFTLGECSQFIPSLVPKNSYLLLQSIIASNPDGGHTISHSSSLLNRITTVKIKAHAFITLGKLCLQNEYFAKKCLPVFIKELVTSEHFIIRCNVIVILVDMCIRYTSLVDPYIPNITFCLKDSSCIIRRQTLTLLTQLLQEDFIKLKGSMFFRMLSSVVDDDPDIKKDAEFVLGHQLLRRQPAIFSHHFVESIFHFNNYEQHTTYNNFFESAEEEKLFSLKGSHYKNKRMALYKFMLDHMKDEEKIGLCLKLCQEILSPVVDEIIPLDKNGEDLLKDCFAVLCCVEIKLSSTSNSQDEAEDGDPAAFVARANKGFLQVLKKKVIENILPIIIALKRVFSEKKSPLLKELMAFLHELTKDYKSELKEIMSAEKPIAKEIECDIRRFEKQQEADRHRRERNSSDSDNFRICVRTPRVSSERQLSRRHSTLRIIHEGSGILSDIKPVSSSAMTNSETPSRKHSKAEAHVRSLVNAFPVREVGQNCLPRSSEQHSASSETHSLKTPKNNEAVTCNKLSNQVAVSEDLNHNSSFPTVQCVPSFSQHQDPETLSSSKKHEGTEVFHKQPVCLTAVGENSCTSSPSSEILNAEVQPHDTAAVNSESIGGSVNTDKNSCEVSNPPNSGTAYNVPSTSDSPLNDLPQGNTTYMNSPLNSRIPLIVLRKYETNKRTRIFHTLANKQDHSAHKQKSRTVSAGDKPGRILSKFNIVTNLTHKNVQTGTGSNGQNSNALVRNKTVKDVGNLFDKTIHDIMCKNHSMCDNPSHELQSVRKPSGEKTSSTPKTVSDRTKDPVICIEKLTPGKLRCYDVCLDNQPSAAETAQKKTSVEIQKRTSMRFAVGEDSANNNCERTRIHKEKELSRKRSCDLPAATNDHKAPRAPEMCKQTDPLSCNKTSGDNHNKRTENAKATDNVRCASKSKHGRVQNSIPGESINPICSDKLESFAEISDKHHSDADEAHVIHKCLTSCSSVCLIKLDDSVIHNAHYTQTCSTPPRASVNTDLRTNSCVCTPCVSVASEVCKTTSVDTTSNTCKTTSSKKQTENS